MLQFPEFKALVSKRFPGTLPESCQFKIEPSQGGNPVYSATLDGTAIAVLVSLEDQSWSIHFEDGPQLKAKSIDGLMESVKDYINKSMRLLTH